MSKTLWAYLEISFSQHKSNEQMTLVDSRVSTLKRMHSDESTGNIPLQDFNSLYGRSRDIHFQTHGSPRVNRQLAIVNSARCGKHSARDIWEFVLHSRSIASSNVDENYEMGMSGDDITSQCHKLLSN